MPSEPKWRWVNELVGVGFVTCLGEREADRLAFAQLSFEEQIKETQRNTRELAYSINRVGILLANGKVHDLWFDAFHGPWFELKTHHCDLQRGTLGSGTALDLISELDPQLQQQDLTLSYGPFLGCPVIMDSDEFTKAVTAKFPWYKDKLSRGLGPAEKEVMASVLGQEPPKRRPGNQPLYDGLIETMVRRQFGPRLSEGGDLVGVKIASVILDGIEWIEKLTGVVVKESTMRDYLAPLRRPEADGK